METRAFKPSPRYVAKLCLLITLLALLIAVGGLLLGWLISHDEDIGVTGGVMVITLVMVSNVIWWIVALVLAGPYYRSLSYEIQDDEVIVRGGIITHSVKHVPYRTVTNIEIRRDLFDRWLFGLGTLNIQTAGMSGQTGVEEKLIALTNVQEVYEIVATQLRRFRGGMAPTAAEVEPEAALAPSQALDAILTEVRAIREAMEKR